MGSFNFFGSYDHGLGNASTSIEFKLVNSSYLFHNPEIWMLFLSRLTPISLFKTATERM